MRKYFTVIAIILGLVALSATHKKAHLLPVSEIIVQRQAYTLAYDGMHRQGDCFDLSNS
jgi:hypothetical protein